MGKKQGVKKGSVQAKTYANRVSAAREATNMVIFQDGMQTALDITSLVLHDIYGFGPDRLKRFAEGFEKKFSLVQRNNREDNEDRDRWYSEEQFEREMREAWGQYYQPRQIRYCEDGR